MKIAVLTDTHHGIKGDSGALSDYQEKFYKDIFFPTIDKEKIEVVFHLGDLYDRRRYINFKTAAETERMFLNPLQERMRNGKILETIILSGNHDLYYRNVNDINSLDILLKGYPEFRVLHNPETRMYHLTPITFFPWICESNHAESMKMIGAGGGVAMGHLELNGYEMYKGIKQTHGMEDTLFSKFDQVYSGHYHHKSSKGNITYLGAICEFTWGDFNDPRGFHIFDTETLAMEFVKNPHTIHKAIKYDDRKDALDFDMSNSFVKVLVINKSNPYRFDKFLDKLYAQNPLDVTIIEDNLIPEMSESESTGDIQETVDIIKESIDGMNTNLSRDRLKREMVSLYNEAIAIGTQEI